MPSFTFVATAHAVRWHGLTPVFCDIDPDSHTLDPASVERMLTPGTTAILATHLWGRPCAVEALTELAQARSLRLIFDAAHALGCSHRGRSIGGFGDAEVFSFHATKFFHTLEGGAIATEDDMLAAALRLSRNFGFTGYDRVAGVGINAKMNEVSAAMGLTNLESIDSFIATNRRNYAAYRRGLSGMPGVRFVEYDERERQNYQYVVIEVDRLAAGLSRDALLRVLHAENVLARRYFWPGCHRMEPYRSLYPEARAARCRRPSAWRTACSSCPRARPRPRTMWRASATSSGWRWGAPRKCRPDAPEIDGQLCIRACAE